jgi:sugar-binding cellulase-like protein
MAQSTFYEEVGYAFERFDSRGYENVVKNAERVYRSRPRHWKNELTKRIQQAAAESRARHLPLVTTECWGIIDYKDWPGLDWGWVKELCEYGTLEAAKTARWVAIATSNFAGPQFRGMWRDVAWHQRLTDAIREASVAPDLLAKH